MIATKKKGLHLHITIIYDCKVKVGNCSNILNRLLLIKVKNGIVETCDIISMAKILNYKR
jgi:hypothetical protein